ncbi:hypothetical protein KC19_4G048400 [Ceratodon purpureus]|nr:hypothetical protein KC19_4G048400 [Ceratodon purpureus]
MTIEWFSWLAEVGMQKHGRLMVSNHLDEDDIEHFNHDLLRSIGVDNAKDRLLILNQKNKHIQRRSSNKNHLSSRQLAAEAQSAIIRRVQTLQVDEVKLVNWIRKTWPLCNRQILIDRGYLSATAPKPGSVAVMANYDRTHIGNELLNSAKDILWAALYGTFESNVLIHRVERELLVITIPGRKAFVFNFFQAVTEVGALGTWRDPANRCHDEDESNMLLQVEYGESANEVVGDAIMVSIHVINLLEVNEVVLYARSSNIEQSTLLTELYFEKHQLAAAMLHKPGEK